MRALATPVRRGAAVWPLLLGFALISCTQRTPNAPGAAASPAGSTAPTTAPAVPPPGGSNGGSTPTTSAPTPGNAESTPPPGEVAPPGSDNGNPAAPDEQQGAADSQQGTGSDPGAVGAQRDGASGRQAAGAGRAAGYPADHVGQLAAADTAAKPAASNVSAVPKVVEAVLEPTKGNKVRGHVRFTARDNVLVIDAMVTGLTPGKHGIHVHENGDCSAPDASSAGGHFNPDGHMHGGPASAIHHAGDLGNLDAMNDGTAKKEVITSDLSLSGRYGVIGRSVVVHADADDYHTNPGGNSGARVACGVIREMTAAEAQHEVQTDKG